MHARVCICVCMYVYVFVCMHVYVFVCAYMCMYLCVRGVNTIFKHNLAVNCLPQKKVYKNDMS